MRSLGNPGWAPAEGRPYHEPNPRGAGTGSETDGWAHRTVLRSARATPHDGPDSLGWDPRRHSRHPLAGRKSQGGIVGMGRPTVLTPKSTILGAFGARPSSGLRMVGALRRRVFHTPSYGVNNVRTDRISEFGGAVPFAVGQSRPIRRDSSQFTS